MEDDCEDDGDDDGDEDEDDGGDDDDEDDGGDDDGDEDDGGDDEDDDVFPGSETVHSLCVFPPQEELSRQISSLIHSFQDVSGRKFDFMCAVNQLIAHEYGGPILPKPKYINWAIN